MKAIVFLLVLGNLLFYAMTQGLFGHPDNPDANRINQQFEAERIRIVSRGEAPASKAGEAATEKPADICLRWDALDLGNADRLEIHLKENFAALAINRQTVAGEGSSWWVSIPPLANKAEADRKAAELRQLGIGDYFIIQDNGANRFAISLGLFSSEKGGQDRLNELKAKGVRSARVTVRPGKDTHYQLEAAGAVADKAKLDEWLAEILPSHPAQACKTR